MKQKDKIITIFGGAGFIGQHIVQELAREGYRLKIITRVPESAYELKTYGTVGQIVACTCNFNDDKAINDAVKGSFAVINLIGILFQKRKNSFKKAHIEIPEKISKACKKENVQKFIHVSALGIDKGQSKYAKSKREGEKLVRATFSKATILRPSVVFGAGDNFFNMFARLSTFLPALPLIGGGKTKFQPVFVGDIAEAVRNIVIEESSKYEGNIYQLGGPEVVTFKEIYERLLKEVNRQRALVSIPWTVARIQGTFLGLMPKPLLTADQVRSLKTDNIIEEPAKKLEDLGVIPTAMAAVLPRYLACYKRGGRFANKKTA
jgi:NADH dehydrogenase